VSETVAATTYVDAENQTLATSNGVTYAYRTTAPQTPSRSCCCSTFVATSTTGIPR